MKKSLLIVCAFMLLFGSCQQEAIVESTADITNEQVLTDPHVCTELCYGDNENGDDPLKGAILKEKKWTNGSVIKVKFLNGTSYLQEKIKTFANEWSRYANIKFEYVASSQNADVKVAFKWNNDSGSWSYVGTDCKKIAQNKPSMNFGWFDNYTSDTEFSRTIIHEFGHALGLIHEHQHPTNGINWNKPVVYDYYKTSQGWSQADVDHNIFRKYSTTETNYSSYDMYSIMHYSIPASHTTDGYSVGWNTVLSETDKKFIGGQYPISVSGMAVAADYDGDGKMDIAVKTSNGGWYIDYSSNGFGYWDWSGSGYAIYDIIPVADYDGDGKADISIRTSDGRWHIDYASNGFGPWDVSYPGIAGGDVIPVPADYDGDGKADISVKTAEGGYFGTWYIDYSGNGFGNWDWSYTGYALYDIIPVGDYDGDGKADISIMTSDGFWHIDYASNGFGRWDVSYPVIAGSNVMPVPADYDGDGKTDISVKTPDGRWYIDYSKNGFGYWDWSGSGYAISKEIPVGDYDGDGKADLVIKTSDGRWHIDFSSNGFGRWDASYLF